MAAGRQVAIIGAALDLGAGRRGVDMGPSAIRYAGLNDRLGGLGYDVLDWGDVETAVPEALVGMGSATEEALVRRTGLAGAELAEAVQRLVVLGYASKGADEGAYRALAQPDG